MGLVLPITIVKIGTNLLTTPDGLPDLGAMKAYVEAISTSFLKQHSRIIMVTSGSITCGS